MVTRHSCTQPQPNEMLMQILRPNYCGLLTVTTAIAVLLPLQAKREEALSIPSQFKDGPGSYSGGGPEHSNGLRWEAEGRTALVCVREAILHEPARTRRTHELLTPFFTWTLGIGWSMETDVLLYCFIVTQMHARVLFETRLSMNIYFCFAQIKKKKKKKTCCLPFLSWWSHEFSHVADCNWC